VNELYAMKASKYVRAYAESPNDPIRLLAGSSSSAISEWNRHLGIARKKGLLVGRARGGPDMPPPSLTPKAQLLGIDAKKAQS
jgi:hypothetical protein